MARHVKKGDTVVVIAGDSKGATGKVMRVIPDKQRVLVEGVNLAYKHVRPSQKNPQGGRIRVERPIHISNVLPVNPKGTKGTRVRFTVDEKGNKQRVAADGTEIGIVTRAAKK
ncbi:MAG TPA: 50S ribosomal protein L24 [Anaerohalosphaeraceae bacterium]|nr:50S ribosomal protein L24 [Anaerohalosphaeraceae bacterium]HOL31084.1 50S ribosomal protein L24 [Anaerohalosphaeraceae bacterium]HOM76179.1 50S ribosomal protein L24 [Anaerohalosphaeraceae bacterium]HPC64658.1 50S ribosomal protein L24 [Anaerohalosphaeraceae bacterium]HPO69790.1 50S ribosomal protein L24 [Anaerohalosphaeraceae bacterium]